VNDDLPIPALDAYLRQQLPLADGPLAVEPFPHGHSNLTYLVRCGSDAWVLRRPPAGRVSKGAHDMARESRILTKLATVYPLAPRSLLFCDDPSIIGAPFHLMERRQGVILRATPPGDLRVTPASMAALCHAVVEQLVALHAIDPIAAGLADIGRPEGYVERQVSGWRRRYADAQTEEIGDMARLGAWLTGNVPAGTAASIVHNDFKFDNLMVSPAVPSRIVAVLDWEMATIGDPLTDLGTTLALWFEAGDPEGLRAVRPSPTSWPGSIGRSALVGLYEELSGRSIGSPLFYYAYGLFKLAVIFQQSYARFVRGQTTDMRFASYRDKVIALAGHAVTVIGSGRL
jgi:aminoglycoside phosphotransferase (APT) family kinase protein